MGMKLSIMRISNGLNYDSSKGISCEDNECGVIDVEPVIP